jgi:hypothetical protein
MGRMGAQGGREGLAGTQEAASPTLTATAAVAAPAAMQKQTKRHLEEPPQKAEAAERMVQKATHPLPLPRLHRVGR